MSRVTVMQPRSVRRLLLTLVSVSLLLSQQTIIGITPAASAANGATTSATTSPATTSPANAAAPNNKPIGDKWAVVIGVGKFADPNVPSLKFAAKDAQDFYNYLVSPTGGKFERDHVQLLLDQNATAANIWDVLGGSFLPYAAAPDDLVVIYISTHGSPADIDIRGANFIVAHDTKIAKLFATGVNMNRLVDTMKERLQSDRLLLVLDTCYSGAGAGAGTGAGAGAQPDKGTGGKGLARVNLDSGALAQGLGSLVICSSSPNQRSWESDKLQNSYFTRYLISSLEKDGGKSGVKSVFEQMKEQVKSEVLREKGQLQTPVISGDFRGLDLVINQPRTALRVAPTWTPMGIENTPVVEKNSAPVQKQSDAVVIMSDSFDRPDAEKYALGRADLALGGVIALSYVPNWPSPQGPIGASIANGALAHTGKDFGGVQIRPLVLQDMSASIDLLVPSDAAGHITQAGPYFRSRWTNPGDGIIGGTSSGFWIRLQSTGQITIKRLNPAAVIAVSNKPASFDNTVFHKLEYALKDNELQVSLDGKLVSFQLEGRSSTTVTLPPTQGNNDGCAGIAFGAEDNRGLVGGQRADNLVIRKYQPLSRGQ